MLSEVTRQHLHDLSVVGKLDLAVGLLQPISPCNPRMTMFLSDELVLSDGGAGRCRTARRARASDFEVVQTKDVVVLTRGSDGPAVGQVWFLADVNGTPCALVSFWPVLRTVEKKVLEVRTSDDGAGLVPLEDILGACAYRRKADDTAQVYIPHAHRDNI